MVITTTQIKMMQPQKVEVVRKQCICNQCKYAWIPKKNKIPRQCPNCKRQDWNKERKK